MEFELLIQNGSKLYQPLVQDGVQWTTERKGSPSKLKFSVVKDDTINFTEGDAVRLKVDGVNVFLGFVFTKKRDKQQIIDVTAYDQMRYLQNKDTYIYNNMTASEVVEMVAADFLLNVGTIEKTSYVIPTRTESDTSLFDVILSALDLELMNTNKLFILYDDFGKLTLKSIDSMKVPLLIDEETGENFEYTSSIDEDTYNVIKYAYASETSSATEVVFSPQLTYENEKKILSDTQRQWGILQYFLKEENVVKSRAQAQAKADALLSLYNGKTRKLKISKAFGDVRVRAGTLPFINLALGDINIQHPLLVERAVHTFSQDDHRMDLTLSGGDFVV